MADFKLVKQLREETNVSYAICQDALKQADGDIIKAREFLREKGADVAAKKQHEMQALRCKQTRHCNRAKNSYRQEEDKGNSCPGKG